jgi:hypothetical protein
MFEGGLVRIKLIVDYISVPMKPKKECCILCEVYANSFHQSLWFNDLVTMHYVENIKRSHEGEDEFSNLVGLMSGVQSKIFAVAVVALQTRTRPTLAGGLVRI